jgi:methylenetetrahydrofolate--tRNA-(uracil-5-)-methyltransferase
MGPSLQPFQSRESRSETGVTIVGAGLAGCEAAWQVARRGVRVVLLDMKPEQMSPAHQSQDLAELVCSNSLRSNTLGNAVGLLKQEMREMSSLILEAADATAVPAGSALAVDRQGFSAHITRAIDSHPLIELRRQLVTEIPDEPRVILATGPLTAPELALDLQRLLGDEYLYFYDAISPTVYSDSIDHDRVFRASRYQQDGGDYLNVPLDAQQYASFVEALLGADTVPLHAFEAALYFEGCLPIEEMARRGPKTLAFGPMKPVGLVDPRTGRRPHAVVQLRQEDKSGVLFNLVGCQTKLRIGEQKRLFRSLPGLEDAIFARFGSVHRNTYVNAPKRLTETLELALRPGLYVAGQMAGVEGYVESAALGGLAGVNAARAALGQCFERPPPETAHGALLGYLEGASARSFQPTNVNYGLFPPLPAASSVREGPEVTAAVRGARRSGRKLPKRERNQRMASRALDALQPFAERIAPGAE